MMVCPNCSNPGMTRVEHNVLYCSACRQSQYVESSPISVEDDWIEWRCATCRRTLVKSVSGCYLRPHRIACPYCELEVAELVARFE